MSTRKRDQELIEAVFGDGPTTADRYSDAEDEELRRLETLNGLLREHGHREPPRSRQEHLWTRLEARLDEEPTSRGLFDLLPIRSLAMGAAAVVVIAVVSVAILRIGTPAVPTSDRLPSAASNHLEAGDRLDRLIDRATPLLMAVSNRSGDAELHAINISSEQRLANDLANESRALREMANGSLTRRDRRLIAELEVVLMQVANTDPSAGSTEIAMLRETIEDRQLLFEFALRDLRETAASPRPERNQNV